MVESDWRKYQPESGMFTFSTQRQIKRNCKTVETQNPTSHPNETISNHV